MDIEIIDIFVNKLHSDIPLIQEYIDSLEQGEDTHVADLFRIFHNYKATASYLELDELFLLVAQGENILNAIRSNQYSIGSYDIKWLRAALIQLKVWCDELYDEQPLSKMDAALFPTITIVNDEEKTSDVMQGLTLLYMDRNEARAQKMKAPLEHVFKAVCTSSDLDHLRHSVLRKSHDIILLNMLDESIEIAQELIKLKPDIALITAIPELRGYQRSRLLMKGITHPILSPIKASELKRQLHNVVTSHFSKVYTIVPHQKIYNFIQGLDPLPSSVKTITELCDDPESSIKDLIHAVESDSITTANVLHAANMPIYAVKNTSSLDQAIVSFGKRLIKALTLSDLACKIGSLQLEAYNINEEQFKDASRLRLALMNSWYAQIDPESLHLLCSSAILGNLGEILINQELVEQGLEEQFKAFKADEFSQAEVKLLKTSSAFVTADILEYWGLDSDLVDSIRYSDAPFNAPTLKVQQLACANAIIYKMITPYGEIQRAIPDSVKALMLKAGLEIDILEKAVQDINIPAEV